MGRQQAVEAAILDRREVVNEAIDEDLPPDHPEDLYEASRYLLKAGGKRLRPTMLLLVAEALADVAPLSADYRDFPAVDDSTVDVLAAAVSVEIIQSFTLIHDDIMDDDEMRRGVPAVHETYGLSTAILAGDTLYSKAFERMLATGATPERSVRALSRLARTCTQICEGQSLDIGYENNPEITTGEYLEMIELKTAVLYAASASIPAILLGYEDAVDPLYGYGLDVGRAFQIQDDLLDLTTPTEKLGKQRGSDLIEDKQTLVTVHARQQGVDVEGLVDAESTDDVTEADIEAAVATLEEVGSIDHARETAREYVRSGKGRLQVLPDSEARDLLAGIADYLIERDY